jgi:hypothetical protein
MLGCAARENHLFDLLGQAVRAMPGVCTACGREVGEAASCPYCSQPPVGSLSASPRHSGTSQIRRDVSMSTAVCIITCSVALTASVVYFVIASRYEIVGIVGGLCVSLPWMGLAVLGFRHRTHVVSGIVVLLAGLGVASLGLAGLLVRLEASILSPGRLDCEIIGTDFLLRRPNHGIGDGCRLRGIGAVPS